MKTIYLIIIIFINSYVFSDEKIDSYYYIDSDELIITKNSLVSEFIGNAYARDSANHFWGDKILIDYDNDKKIKLITIIGNVKIKLPDEVATGDEAVYNPKSEKVRINGNITVIKDSNILNGDELIVDLLTSTSIIKGNIDKQVSAKVIE
tara:strand:- start:869 stop:1318 length:450 start_codon:yes stop_codon:yes gene_type:complete